MHEPAPYTTAAQAATDVDAAADAVEPIALVVEPIALVVERSIEDAGRRIRWYGLVIAVVASIVGAFTLLPDPGSRAYAASVVAMITPLAVYGIWCLVSVRRGRAAPLADTTGEQRQDPEVVDIFERVNVILASFDATPGDSARSIDSFRIGASIGNHDGADAFRSTLHVPTREAEPGADRNADRNDAWPVPGRGA